MRNGQRLTIGLAAVAALPLLYSGAYLALLEPSAQLPAGDLRHVTLVRVPRYRIGGNTAEWLFAPIHYVDRILRPNFWAEEHDLTRGV